MISWDSFQRLPTVMTPLQWGVVIVTFALAIWIIVRLRSHFREDTDDADVTLEMLTQFRELHQQGGLSDDEFRLIRSRLTRSVQKAIVTEPSQPKVSTDSNEPSNSTESTGKTSSQSPENLATTEKLEMSERMPDNEKE